jgi:hypothetical protein
MIDNTHQTTFELFFRLANDIMYLTSADFQRRLMMDRSTKLELILAGKYT